MDSLTETKLNHYKKNNIEIKQFAIEKDKTDGELALDYCKQNNYQQINIIGAIGGRIDQQLANIYLLEYALKLKMEAVIREADIEIGILNQKNNLKIFFKKQNSRLSLIPLSNKVTGVTITGCKYKLKQSSLFRYQTRGISNQIEESQAKVSMKTGVLLYIIES
jgi:thiamine pyrophosphokinase